MFGLTRGTTRAHLARAALDAIAFQVADVVEAMRDDTGIARSIHVDGGAAANDLLMQIQADVLGVPVIRPKALETTALGAAYLAGLAVGLWRSTDDVAEHGRIDRRFDPAPATDASRERRARWSEAIHRSRAWTT